jgi:hypothetical protein
MKDMAVQASAMTTLRERAGCSGNASGHMKSVTFSSEPQRARSI